MKKNVQLYNSSELRIAIQGQSKNWKSFTICSNGDFVINYEDCTQDIFSPNEIAEKINMPLWEVVMIDRFGEDEYALLFYEEG